MLQKILKKEAKSVGVYAASQLLTRFGGFLLLPLYWSKLTPEDFGIIALAEILGAFFLPIFSLCLDIGLTRLYYQWPASRRKAGVGTIWILYWSSAFLTGAAAITLVSFLSPVLYPTIPFYPLIFLGLLAALLNNLSQVMFAVLRIQQRSQTFALFSVLRFLIQSSLILSFFYIWNRGLTGYFQANVVAGGVAALISGGFMLTAASFSWQADIARAALRFSVPLIPSSLLAGFGGLFERTLLERFAGLEAVGLYMLSLKFAMIVTGVNDLMKFSYGPFSYKTLEADPVGGPKAVCRMLPFYILPILGAALGISLFIRGFVLFSGQSAYEPVISLTPLAVAPAFLLCLNIYYTPGLVLAQRTEWSIVPVLANLAVLALCSWWLIPSQGVYGLIAAKFVAGLVFFAVSAFLSYRFYPVWHPNWRTLAIFVGILGAGIAASGLLRPLNPFENIAGSILTFLLLSLAAYLVARRSSSASL